MHAALRTAVALAAGAVGVHAQRTLYSFPAQTTHRATAAPVETVGDIDGDGGADFALGQALGGGVELRSGATGRVLIAIPDPGLNALYATALARIADLDGDGLDDLAVGSSHRLQVGSAGFVELRSTLDGALLARFPGPTDRSFGYAVEALDDLDGDGLEDLVVGDPENFSEPDGPTSVHAVSSADGAILWSVERPSAERIGRTLARLADLDGDGLDEVATSVAPLGAAAVLVLSGADGQVLRAIPHPSNGFGARLERIGDLDGDGFDELAVSSLMEEVGPGRTGVVRIHRSVDGTLVRVLRPVGPHGAFGAGLAAGDLDGDGTPDVVVGQSILEAVVFEGNRGAVLAFSGAGGRLLFQRLGDSPMSELGNALAFLGDADGDGTREVVATGLFDAHFSAFGHGIAFLDGRRFRRAGGASPPP
jgi:hypothetical protein